MNKSGIGLGSASVLLVFVVLALTIFAIISFITAGNDLALARAERELVVGFYQADKEAELVLYSLVPDMLSQPDMIGETKIFWGWDSRLMVETAEFAVPVNENMELYVKLVLRDYYFDILAWQMRATTPWELELEIPNLWQGDWGN